MMIDPEEPRPSSSLPASPSSIHMDPVSPFGSDIEVCHSDEEQDPYFMSLVDNFVAAVDVGRSTFADEDDYAVAAFHQNSILCAETALEHYNNDEKNKIKYELIYVVKRYQMLEENGFYSHVNFIAKGNQQNSEEELFFAELLSKVVTGGIIYKTTCVISLQGDKVDGLRGDTLGNFTTEFDGKGFKDLPTDNKHCYACVKSIKHPKELPFEAGHISYSGYYHDG